MNINLRELFVETPKYKAWKFPAGEVQFGLTPEGVAECSRAESIDIDIRLINGDAVLMLMMTIDGIRKVNPVVPITAYIGYMPYQQADKAKEDECLPLSVITSLLKSLDVAKYVIYDPHSDVSPAFLHQRCRVVNNDLLVQNALTNIAFNVITPGCNDWTACQDKIALLSPDAGAFKKLFPLTDRIGFKGTTISANKSRSDDGVITMDLYAERAKGKHCLIIDDLALGGKTFTTLADYLIPHEPAGLYLCVSHGIFNYGTEHLNKYFKHIFCTDTYRDVNDPNVSCYSWRTMDKVAQLEN